MDDLNIYETVKNKVAENATFTKVKIDEIDPRTIANMFGMAKLCFGNSGISDDMINNFAISNMCSTKRSLE